MRDVRGKVVPPDKDEKVKGQKAIEAEESAGKHHDPAAHLANCDDCMKNVITHMGTGEKANGFKSEDQGSKAKIEAGETREKRGGAERRHH